MHILSLRLDDKMFRDLRRQAGDNPVSDVAREALRRHLAVLRFGEIAANITKAAAQKGIITGDDADRAVHAGIKRRRCR